MIDDSKFKILVNGDVSNARGQTFALPEFFFLGVKIRARNFRLEKKTRFFKISVERSLMSRTSLESTKPRSKNFEHFFSLSRRQPET